MKIHQLPMGARFEYEGVEYVKSGPLFGTGPQGQRLIPKYALLRSLDQPSELSVARASVTRTSVAKAFDAFYTVARQVAKPGAEIELEAAKQAFFRTLENK